MIAYMAYGMDERMASYRYRMSIPGRELAKRGHVVQFLKGPYKPKADVAVFMKHGIPGEAELAQETKKSGVRVVFDVCDDHFQKKDLGPHYRAMVDLADTVTVPTESMADVVSRETKKTAKVVPDPYELDVVGPHAKGNSLIWFGHQTNLKELQPFVNKLDGWKFLAVTGENQWLKQYVEWSPKNLRAALRNANVALIPSTKTAGSPNRVIEAIRSGCFVVASDAPKSYRPFGEWMWIGDCEKGLQWVREHQEELNDRVSEAQDYVAKNFSPESIALKWEEVL